MSRFGPIVSIAAACFATAAFAAPSQPAATYTPLAHREAEWYGSTFWSGPNWTRVGRDWHHPGESTPSVRRFTAPRDGRATISGRVFKLHLAGDGIRAAIRHNDREIWKAEIDGRDDKGVEPRVTFELKKGDSLRFIVHKHGGIGCDTTGWDPLVTYADGERFQASASFAAKKQGVGGWHYEMVGGPEARLPFPPVCAELRREMARLAPALAPGVEPALLDLVVEEWWREDKLSDAEKSYAAAAAEQLTRAKRLAENLGRANLANVDALDRAAPADLAAWRTHYLTVRLRKRELALAHPLFRSTPLLVCKRAPPSWSHLVAQYYGWRQRPGGGIYVVERPGRSLAVRDVLHGQLPPGCVLEPRLSYDGRRILFAFVACTAEVPDPASLRVNESGSQERYFHLYEINVDGSGLRQLTDGPYDDMMAEYLPDGGLVFCSTRRKGYSRCFGAEYSYRWHSYTLHRMDADGQNIRTLSFNDVSEWFPAVSNTGHILHARWDYIDRDAVTHQNLWSVRPDGTNPLAVWGNASPKPHCVFQAKPIPNSSKIVFIGSAHHAITAGPVCVVDPTVDANSLDAVTRITPLAFPEAEGKLDEWYESPWPLSETLFLTAYSPYPLRFQGEHMHDPNPDNALGVYLLDAAGNRELLYRDPQISTTNPTPLAARPCPPTLPSALPNTLPADAPPVGRMVVSDIYQGLGDAARGSIKAIRVVQVFPKSTWLANQPRIGVAGEENGRAILGTVPVEADGSAYFDVPAGKPILFQALDAQGMAYQTMRSLTYVQPGERTACVGCHEGRMSAPPTDARTPLAVRRGPSQIEPGELGGRPFGFVEVVQPILDRHCVRCHGGERIDGKVDLRGTPQQGFTQSYWALCGTPGEWKSLDFNPELAAARLVPRFVQRNRIQTTPTGGTFGARGSRLMKLLAAGHEGAVLAPNELQHVAAWIDMNAIFYGVYEPEQQARQLLGQRVAMPEIQ